MPYEFIPISTMIIFVYIITYVLYKENEISRWTHLRIWNFIILFISIVLIIIGLILTTLIEYSINSVLAFSILFWHVEVGIALVTVTFIHVYLYWKSFKKVTLRIRVIK